MDKSYSIEIDKKIEQSNFRRLNLMIKVVVLVHIGVIFTLDIISYVNDVWSAIPSQYSAFLNRVISLPFLLLIYKLNTAFLKRKAFVKTSDWLLLLNLIVLTTMVMVYYYWDVKDYFSSGAFIIYICVFGFVLQFSRIRRYLISAYFFVCYFGVLVIHKVSYLENPSIFMLGVGVLALFVVISKHLFSERITSMKREIALQETVAKLGTSNKQLSAELKSKLMLLNQNNDMLDKFTEIIKNRASNPHIFSDLNKLISSSTSENIISELEEQFLGVHQEFIQELSSRYPQLTAYNIKLCILIKLGLTSREIAQLRYVTYESVKVAKSRLRKSLDTDIDLFTFFNSFQSEPTQM